MAASNLFHFDVADDGEVTTNAIIVAGWDRGAFYLPSTFTTSNVTYSVSLDGTTYVALQGQDSAAIAAMSAIVAGEQIPINVNVFSFYSMKLAFASAQASGPLEIPVRLFRTGP